MSYQISWNFGSVDSWICWSKIDMNIRAQPGGSTQSDGCAERPNKSIYVQWWIVWQLYSTLNDEHSNTPLHTNTWYTKPDEAVKSYNRTKAEPTKRQNHERLLIFNQKSILYGVRLLPQFVLLLHMVRYRMLCFIFATTISTRATLPTYNKLKHRAL